MVVFSQPIASSSLDYYYLFIVLKAWNEVLAACSLYGSGNARR